MILIDKWQGLFTNASPYAVPGGGFVEQTNVQCLRPGQIETRKGYSPSGFTMTSVGTLPVTSIIALPNGTMVIVASGNYQTAEFRAATK